MGKSIWPAHGRNSCHLEGSIEASVERLVVGNEVVVVSLASRRRDLVEDLEVNLGWRGTGSGLGVERAPCRRTSRCSGRGPINSRSVFNEPGPRGSTDDRRTPRGPGSATIEHHLTAHAAERQGVRRSDDGRWKVPRRLVIDVQDGDDDRSTSGGQRPSARRCGLAMGNPDGRRG